MIGSTDKRNFSEEKVLEELHLLIDTLPAGSAIFHELPVKPEWLCRYYEVEPTNNKAAKLIVGVVLNDLHLTIGEVECELIGFGRGATISPKTSWQDDLRWIWRVTTVGGFLQQQYLDNEGTVIGGASVLKLEGVTYDFRCGRVAKTLFGKRTYRTILYEAYF